MPEVQVHAEKGDEVEQDDDAGGENNGLPDGGVIGAEAVAKQKLSADCDADK